MLAGFTKLISNSDITNKMTVDDGALPIEFRYYKFKMASNDFDI